MNIVDKSLLSSDERMLPENAPPGQFWEHIYRYRFATKYVRNKRVLDVACGEGYGSYALLKSGALSIIGLDVSKDAINYASSKYENYCIVGDAESIPLQSKSQNVVVSFETIEHLQNPSSFVAECARVLRPRGILIMSTPNKEVSNGTNTFHIREYTLKELILIIAPFFHRLIIYTQVPVFTKVWSLRAFSAMESPWKNIRGFWRSRETIRSILCPHIRGNVAKSYRESPVDAICKDFSKLSSWCNPYVVRRTSSLNVEKPRYFIIVAEAR